MRIKRFFKYNWYMIIGLLLIIIVLILPKNRSNESDMYKNCNHNYKEKIVVYVEGEVLIKGKMYFYSTNTVLDLLNCAKVTDYSNTKGIDLSELLKDGNTYNIDIDPTNSKTVIINNKSTSVNNIIDSSSKIENNLSDLININKASQADFETLPSIGSVRAKNIIQYRNKNGNFSQIEEIKKVKGITDVIFDQIKDFITC